jgi:hypothetical protein
MNKKMRPWPAKQDRSTEREREREREREMHGARTFAGEWFSDARVPMAVVVPSPSSTSVFAASLALEEEIESEADDGRRGEEYQAADQRPPARLRSFIELEWKHGASIPALSTRPGGSIHR